jgi:Ca-activated chloride channel family protein
MDVSVSMKDHNRMDLLKQSIIQLLQLMRPSDRVSIITFSSDTRIILSPTLLSDDKKTVAIDIVSSLKPGGMTNGGKGLKTAFKLIRENFNSDQNNQVILATDGALGAYMKHEKIIEMVQKNVSFASTSVMTLNGYNWSGKFMRQIVRAGEGELIPINSAREAQLSLVKAIKKQARVIE